MSRNHNRAILFYILFSLILYMGCAAHQPRIKDQRPENTVEQIVETYQTFIQDEDTGDNKPVFPVGQYDEKEVLDNAPLEKPLFSYSHKTGEPELPPDRMNIRKKADISFNPPEEKEVSSESADIVFNFDNADIYEVIRTMSELLHINYIVDPNVRGNVTIHTAGKLKKENLFTIFYQILEANGLTAIKEGSLYKIIPLKDAARMPIISKFGRESGKLSGAERIIMQIIPLNHISAQEMTTLLTPFISAEGTIISHGDSNTLLIVDKGINILKALKLINAFDIDIFEAVTHRFYPLKYVDAEETAKLITDIFSAYGKEDKKGLKIVAVKRLNTILAISQDAGVFAKMESFVRQLDLPSDDAEPGIYVYSVKNGEAEEISTLLNTVFTGKIETENKLKSADSSSDDKSKPSVSSPASPFADKTVEKDVKKAISNQIRENQGTGTLKGDIKITPDKIRNALIIEAIPSDYRIVENILKRIDVLPRQVLIEATIAEITLDNSNDMGIGWSFDKSVSHDTGLLTANISGEGLRYTIGLTEKWTNTLSALASQKKVNILSSPILLASDNKEAQINVSTKIPIPTTEYQYESDTKPIFQTSIQYRDTGLILSVTPHINERGLVSMDISQEISEEGGGIDVAGKNYPTFRERAVKTTLTVKDGQTIVLGGLMEETKDNSSSGVPYLSEIPILGYLFGKKSDSFVKKELIILITPRVIINQDDVDIITEEFKRKVADIRGQIG